MWQLFGKNGIFLKMNLEIKLYMRTEVLLLVLLSISGIRSLRNGETVEKGHYSYVVSIWVYESFASEYRCSGVVLSRSHILTAGHCVYGIMAHNIIATNAFECTSLAYPVGFVDTIIIHPLFRRAFHPDKPTTTYWINDIAVLKVMCDFTMSSTLVAVALDRRRHYRNNGEECFIAGWASMVSDTPLHLVLNKADATVLDSGISQLNSFLLPHEIYAFLTHSQALIDDMDSGNALICGGKAVGIIVGGRDRTRSVVSVLTIAPYKKFIDDTMSVNQENQAL